MVALSSQREKSPTRAAGIRPFKAAYFVVIAVTVPILQPQLPGNSIPFDVLNAVFIAFFLPSLLLGRNRFVLPAIGPVALMSLGAFVGTLYFSFTNNPNVAPSYFLLFAQEVYLFVWFLVLVNLLRTETELKFLIISFVVAAAGYGLFALAEVGLSGLGVVRFEGLFRDPNMAGFYFTIAAFLALTPAFKPPKLIHVAIVALLVGAVISTGSITSLGSIATGFSIFALIHFLRNPAQFVLWVVPLAVMIVVLLLAYRSEIRLPVREATPVIGGRFDRSIADRNLIWGSTLKTISEHPLGLGNGYSAIRGIQMPHNQYLRHTLERGLVGLLGLLWFYGYFVRRVWRIQSNEFTPRDSDALSRWAQALGAGLVVILIFGLGHDIFHFRYFWLFFAVIAASPILTKAASRPTRWQSLSPLTKGSNTGL